MAVVVAGADLSVNTAAAAAAAAAAATAVEATVALTGCAPPTIRRRATLGSRRCGGNAE